MAEHAKTVLKGLFMREKGGPTSFHGLRCLWYGPGLALVPSFAGRGTSC